MALKDSWNDKVNGKDIVDAEDINSIARAVIEITDEINAIKSDITELQTALIRVSELIGGDA